MVAVPSAWLVGSITIPVQNFTANGNAAQVAAGTYYLRHTTDGISLISAFNAAVENAMGGGGLCTLRRSRQVNLVMAPNVAIAWGAATQLRDLLGWAADIASGGSHLAPNVSPLLFSAGFPATPKTPVGTDGYSKPHQVKSKSDDGTRLLTYHLGKETRQELEWSHVGISRLRVTSGTGGGTFHEFFEQSAMLGYQMLHHEVTEDLADSTTDVTWGTALGPYVLRGDFDGDWYARRVRGSDVSSPLRLPLQKVSEYS